MVKIDAILFDKDGTLFDFQATWGVWCATLLEDLSGGVPSRRGALAAAIGYDLASGRVRPGSVVVADPPEAIAAAMAPHLTEWSATALLAHMNAAATRAPQVEIVPLAPIFARLRSAGLRLGVVTNDAEASARAHLLGAGIMDHLDFIAGSDSGFAPKPAPDALLGFCARFGLAPHRVAMVGDSLHDMQAGRAARMICIAVDSPTSSSEAMARAADVTLRDIGALHRWIFGAASRRR